MTNTKPWDVLDPQLREAYRRVSLHPLQFSANVAVDRSIVEMLVSQATLTEPYLDHLAYDLRFSLVSALYGERERRVHTEPRTWWSHLLYDLSQSPRAPRWLRTWCRQRVRYKETTYASYRFWANLPPPPEKHQPTYEIVVRER